MCIIDARDDKPSEKEVQEMIEKDCILEFLEETFDTGELSKMLYEKLNEKEKKKIIWEMEEDWKNEQRYP